MNDTHNAHNSTEMDGSVQPMRRCRHCGEPIVPIVIDGEVQNEWKHPYVELSETEFEDSRYCDPSDEFISERAEPVEKAAPDFAFNVKMEAVVRVQATTEDEARIALMKLRPVGARVHMGPATLGEFRFSGPFVSREFDGRFEFDELESVTHGTTEVSEPFDVIEGAREYLTSEYPHAAEVIMRALRSEIVRIIEQVYTDGWYQFTLDALS